jgi:hypothetical protein
MFSIGGFLGAVMEKRQLVVVAAQGVVIPGRRVAAVLVDQVHIGLVVSIMQQDWEQRARGTTERFRPAPIHLRVVPVQGQRVATRVVLMVEQVVLV